MSQTAYPSADQADPDRIPNRTVTPDLPLWDELAAGVSPADRVEHAHREDLHARINLPFGHDALQLDYALDDQYGYPPPGAPNVQDFQSGHTQVTILNQAAEQGWGVDPAFAWPRYPHMENHARAYSWGVARRFGGLLAPKDFRGLYTGMQQTRDHQLRHAVMHAVHQVIYANASTIPNTYAVKPREPVYSSAPIGAEGVLPG